MHMADALISPLVGGSMLLTTVGVSAYSIKNLKIDSNDYKIPLMGVMGAFIFSAQMINFTIPGTGSSGHLGGGLLLAILLGPELGFLTLAAILLIQAMMFGDGGLLAYGCNVFNLGFYTCYLAYPLIYKRIVGNAPSERRLFWGCLIAAVIGLQFGAFSVVIETFLSGKTALSMSKFLMLMQPIHLGIGLVEGLITASIVLFLWKARPELILPLERPKRKLNHVIFIGLIVALLVGGMLSTFASDHPDGLEWALEKTLVQSEISQDAEGSVFSKIQSQTAVMPDYKAPIDTERKYVIDLSTGMAGLIGVLFTFIVAILMGIIIRRSKKHIANMKRG